MLDISEADCDALIRHFEPTEAGSKVSLGINTNV